MESSSPTPELEEGEKKRFPVLAALFVVGGLVAVGVAGFSFYRQTKEGYNEGNGESESSEKESD